MRYLPLTTEERNKILKTCGVSSFDELVAAIPDSLRLKNLLDIEPALHERSLRNFIAELGAKNQASKMTSYLGQGIYDHDWPVVIDQLINRGEFLTAYTPYQPEISQGTLQSIFEFQSQIADLYKMDVANASLYDGSTALVEAVLMSARLQNKKTGKVVVGEGLYEESLEVLKTYLEPLGYEIEIWPADAQKFMCTGATLPAQAESPLALVLQSPNRWGLIEDFDLLGKSAKQLNTKSVAHVAHPYSLSLFPTPGDSGIDVVSGEGQSLGLAPGFGGPLLGLFAARKEHVRQMPGRLVGATVDAKGQRAFCVTLSTREQHIRREKATSNICSNQNLMALRACIYMALMGPEGLKQKAQMCRDRAYYFRDQIRELLKKYHPEIRVLEGECFNEISLLVPQKQSLSIEGVQKLAEKQGILAGITIRSARASNYVSCLSLAFTENHSRSQIDSLVDVFSKNETL